MYQDKKIELSKYNINGDLKSECRYKKGENEIEEVQNQQLLSSRRIESEVFKSNYTVFEQLNSSKDSSLNIKYKINHLKSGTKENQDETKKLLNEMEFRDSEIRNLKDAINRLAQKNTDLHTVFKVLLYIVFKLLLIYCYSNHYLILLYHTHAFFYFNARKTII